MTDDLFILMTDWPRPRAIEDFVQAALEQGYDGVETWWPIDPEAQRRLTAAVRSSGAALSLLSGGGPETPQDHIADIHRRNLQIADSGLDPLHVTLHAGRDHWSDADHDRLADQIREDRETAGLDVLVELHRSRMLFSAHTAKRVLDRHPDLRVTFDVSHWLVVAESMLEDQPDAVATAVARADHVHARIGHPEGPQVNDPEAPEWDEIVEQHLRWWDEIVRRRRAEDRPATFLAEFGPVDYAPASPTSREPLRDPESSNRWMQRVLRERYDSSTPAEDEPVSE